MSNEEELASAKAAAKKLQEAAHGGPPVAIPGAVDAGNTPLDAAPASVPPPRPAGPSNTAAAHADRVFKSGADQPTK
jgi:hypothetical protein